MKRNLTALDLSSVQETFKWRLPELSYFGRLAFPSLPFSSLTTSLGALTRYFLLLLSFGLLSQPIYVWAFGRTDLNICSVMSLSNSVSM